MSKTVDEWVEQERQYLQGWQRIEDRSNGFNVNASSNGVPRLGRTVDFRTLVAGPAMAVTSSSGLCRYQYLSVGRVANTCSVTTITYSLHRYYQFYEQVLYLFIEYGIFCPGEGAGTCSLSRWYLLAQPVYLISTRLYLLTQLVPVN